MNCTKNFVLMAFLSAFASQGLALSANEMRESDPGRYLAKKSSSEKFSKKKKATESEAHADEDHDGRSDTSKDNRRDIKFVATATLIGISNGSLMGGDIGYFVKSDLAIMGRYEVGSFNLNFFGLDIFNYSVKSYGIYGKKFWGNSFYANLGIFHRVLELTKWDSIESTSPSSTNSTLSLKSAQIVQKASQQDIEIAIGNQWQWENFTLGCDWLGFMIPIAKKIDMNERQVSTNGGPYEKDPSQNPDSDPAFVGVRFLALYLGLSF